MKAQTSVEDATQMADKEIEHAQDYMARAFADAGEALRETARRVEMRNFDRLSAGLFSETWAWGADVGGVGR